MAIRPFQVASICAGYDGLGLSVQVCIPQARTVVYVEREAFAAANLVAKMVAGALAEAPVWSDLATFDGRPWRGKVDLITAGLPCQPYSVAGKQRGHADERAIWPEFVRVVGECRPTLVFLENVPAFLAWAREPLTELCRMGYTVEKPLILSASDVGANHRRERVWILAHAGRVFGAGGQANAGVSLNTDKSSQGLQEGRSDVAYAGREHVNAQQRLHGAEPAGSGEDGICDTDKQYLHGRCAAGHKGQARPADRCGGWWAVEPDVGRVANDVADRVDRLRLLGNGVVPLQAAVAFGILMDRAFGEESD